MLVLMWRVLVADQPRGAGVAERAEGSDLAGAASAAGGSQPGAAGRLPLRAAAAHPRPRADPPRLQVSILLTAVANRR